MAAPQAWAIAGIVHLGPGPQLYGQGGDPTSPHSAGQLPLYAAWACKPTCLNRPDLQGHVESVTRLRP